MMLGILIASFLLDGLLTNYLPFFQGDLSLWTPYLTIVALFLILPFFRKEEANKYYWCAIICGFLYDIFYTNLLMSHVLFFLILAFLSRQIWKNIAVNFMTLPFILTFLIGVYHLVFMGILLLFNLIKPTLSHFFYLWGHSLLLNLVIGEIIYFILFKTNKKYRRMRL